jgi:hypothetical protein
MLDMYALRAGEAAYLLVRAPPPRLTQPSRPCRVAAAPDVCWQAFFDGLNDRKTLRLLPNMAFGRAMATWMQSETTAANASDAAVRRPPSGTVHVDRQAHQAHAWVGVCGGATMA